MSTVPRKYPEAIAWVNTRLPIWSAAPTTIGLEATQVADLASLASSAETARSDYDAAKADSDAKYEAYQAAAGAMRSVAAAQVTQIRGFARSGGDPASVYSAAQIPAPATPTPAPAPGTPGFFTVQLLDGGGLKFAFKCDHPTGVKAVTYKVERQQVAQGPFEFLLNAKKREFEDTTFDNASTVIAYRVTAQTSTKDGAAASFTVRYGAGNQSVVLSQGEDQQAAA